MLPPTGLGIADDEVQVLAELAIGRACLDIGTGTGRSAEALALTARSVTTCDPSPQRVPPAVDFRPCGWEDLEWEGWEVVFVDHFGDRASCAHAVAAHPSVQVVAVHDLRIMWQLPDQLRAVDGFTFTHVESALGIGVLRRSP